jgi:hypothetical protein
MAYLMRFVAFECHHKGLQVIVPMDVEIPQEFKNKPENVNLKPSGAYFPLINISVPVPQEFTLLSRILLCGVIVNLSFLYGCQSLTSTIYVPY